MVQSLLIIGGGIVGVAMARQAQKQGLNVTLADAGGEYPGEGLLSTDGTQEHPKNYYDIIQTRVSALGGGSWIWGGNSAPFEEDDFAPLTKESPSWLIGHNDLAPFHKSAQSFLDIDGSWSVKDHFDKEAPEGPFYFGKLYKLSALIEPKGGNRMGNAFTRHKESMRKINVLSQHLLTDLVAINGRITEAIFQDTAHEKTVSMSADSIVLACGGLENSRQLLLLAEKNSPVTQHIANDIGCYWSEHPHPYFGTMAFGEEFLPFAIARTKKSKHNKRYVARVKFSLKERTKIKGPPLSHTMQIVAKKDKHYMTSINEQLPLRSNRVSLSKTEKDETGRPLLHLNYTVDAITRQRIWSAHELMVRYMGSHDKTRLKRRMTHESFMMPNYFLGGGHHHMGGTCMGAREHGGIVDKDCRVYGTENLYIAGSSVFPRGASVNPTLNAIALAYYTVNQIKKG